MIIDFCLASFVTNFLVSAASNAAGMSKKTSQRDITLVDFLVGYFTGKAEYWDKNWQGRRRPSSPMLSSATYLSDD